MVYLLQTTCGNSRVPQVHCGKDVSTGDKVCLLLAAAICCRNALAMGQCLTNSYMLIGEPSSVLAISGMIRSYQIKSQHSNERGYGILGRLLL